MRQYFFLLFWMIVFPLFGQNSEDAKPLPHIYIIKNATVVQKPGIILDHTDLLIKDGLIVEIGKNLQMYNAQIIKGDSMFVYAGFIDGFSHIGISNSEKKETPKIENPLLPADNLVGISPQILGMSVFNQAEKSISEWRNVGITLANIAPKGPFLPGQSSIILLGEGSSDRLTLSKSSGTAMNLQNASRAFPSTSIGIMAKFRELFIRAKNYKIQEETYIKSPIGRPRPAFSAELDALVPITTKAKPVFFAASNLKDIHKATNLCEELSFKLSLVDVKQAWLCTEPIKQVGANVFLSLELPQSESKKDTSKTKQDSLSSTSNTIFPEQLHFDSLKQKSIEDHQKQAAFLEKSGIPFGFSLLSAKSQDFKKSILTYIKNGLSPDAALAALTTYPAVVLGIDKWVGTIEKGKLANLILTDKPYFNDKSSIIAVFVEGKKFPSEKKNTNESKIDSKNTKYLGTWSYTVNIPGSIEKGTMKISNENSNLAIEIISDSSPSEPDSAFNIELNDNKLSFTINADLGQPTKIDFDLTLDTKNYSGTISIPQFGIFPIEGNLITSPQTSTN
ncbi:MAG: amidohydrolase family protein [Saprospiraceae bacterium]